MTAPLPDLLVDRMERAATASAAVLRRSAYEVLAAAGVDVPRLVEDTRGAMLRERGAIAETKAKRLRMLRDRIAAGKLPPERLERAKEQLAKLPNEVKAIRRALKRIEERPAPPLPSAQIAMAFNTTAELVREAVDTHPWLYSSHNDDPSQQRVESDGE